MSVPRSRFFLTRVITRLYRLAARRSRITAMRHPAILARMLFPAQSASGKRSLPYCQRADAICLQSTATSALLIRPGQQECIDQPPDEHYACAPAEYAAPFALRAERFQCERPGSREQRRCGQRPRLDGQRIVERKPALKPNEPCMALNRLAHRPPDRPYPQGSQAENTPVHPIPRGMPGGWDAAHAF